MLLKKWRLSLGYSLDVAAPMVGLTRGSFSEIENGISMPRIENVLVIEGVTGGRVSLLDHFFAWQKRNSIKATELRDRGRALAKVNRPAKRKATTRHGHKP